MSRFRKLINFSLAARECYNGRISPIWHIQTRFNTKVNCNEAKYNFLNDQNIKKLLSDDFANWSNVKKTLMESPDFNITESNVNASVLQYCLNAGMIEVGLAFCRYLLQEKETLTFKENLLLVKLLKDTKVENYKDLVLHLYEVFKADLPSQIVLQPTLFPIFYPFHEIWKEVSEIFLKNEIEFSATGFLLTACGAFEHEEPDIGWKLLNKYSGMLNSSVIDQYFQYCIKKAKKKEFSLKLIDDIVSFTNENTMVFPNQNLFKLLTILTDILNSDPDEKMKWSVTQTKVNNNVCSCCQRRLKSLIFSKQQLESLKKYFINDVFINKNVNIKTSASEIKEFLNFLDNCKIYHVVFDLLNLTFKSIDLPEVITFFSKRNMNVLFIGRSYVKKMAIYPYLRQMGQIFLTSSDSDDDIFTIYSALHSKTNAGILSDDFFRGYQNYITDENKQKLFIKWRISHQYYFHKKKILVPQSHANLPQATCTPNENNKEFCWHLSAQPSKFPKLKPLETFYWICLRAEPKTEIPSNNLLDSNLTNSSAQ